MTIESEILIRSESKCELCSSRNETSIFEISAGAEKNSAILICKTCHEFHLKPEEIDISHWQPLLSSMWSEVEPVQIEVYRILTRLGNNSWSQDLLSQMYLTDEQLDWVNSGLEKIENSNTVDSNGAPLDHGDSVILIKDLVVKGANFTAKRGTLVKNISLSTNTDHIEGKVNGVKIVLITAYLKKI